MRNKQPSKAAGKNEQDIAHPLLQFLKHIHTHIILSFPTLLDSIVSPVVLLLSILVSFIYVQIAYYFWRVIIHQRFLSPSIRLCQYLIFTIP